MAKASGQFLIFDSAHAYGSSYNGTKVGVFGDAEVFSLSGTKVVTTAEGGLVATGHDWLAEKLQCFRGHGFKIDYESRVVGLNAKLSELHAALGTLTLPKIEESILRRRAIRDAYKDELAEEVVWQHVRDADRSTYKDICIRVNCDVGALQQKFADAGIQTKRYFRPLHTMRLFKDFATLALPNTESVYDASLCVPVFEDMPDSAVSRVADMIRRYSSSTVESDT